MHTASRFEFDYAKLIKRIMEEGSIRETRNGKTRSIFGTHLEVDMSDNHMFPLLTGRKMYYTGVLGELAAMLRGPKHLSDFERWGCNYWKDWADEDGNLRVDYGNAWLDFNGVNQLESLLDKLKNDPTDRRLLISSWRPDHLAELSLPCCHHTYQWYVREGEYLDMLWMQRSVDTMIGLPSDIILAAAWNILIANEVGLKPGKLTFSMGDTHIYEEHLQQAEEYMDRVFFGTNAPAPKYALLSLREAKVVDFDPVELYIYEYNPLAPIKFELKA